MACPISNACPAWDRIFVERSRSRREWTIWNVHTMTRSTDDSHDAHTWTLSYRAVQYAPYELKEGNWDEKRDEFGETVIDTLSEYAPNLRDIILHRQVLTPLDIERTFSLTEGNIFHGELSLQQLYFMRPVLGWAQYRTPIRNLYICGSSTHPGGGIMGAPGRNAALKLLKDRSL